MGHPRMSVQICSECGQAFDCDQCWVCVARKEDILETFTFSLPVAVGGITIGVIFAISLYPPLGSSLTTIYRIPVLSFVGAVVLGLVIRRQLTRYATAVRLIIVLVTVAFVMPAAYYFLNGLLDANPAMEVPSRVITKDIGHGRYGGPVLVVSLSWNQKRIEENIGVSHEKYSAAEPGDSVRVVVHPGAFSQPWYGDVLLSSTGKRDSR
jgi:hypothetical protein